MLLNSRCLEKELFSRISLGKIHILFGARQTGKTSLLRKGSNDKLLWVDLQNSERRTEFSKRPHSFSDLLMGEQARSKKRLKVLVDEIQKLPLLLEEIQGLYDNHRDRFDFYLTGSSIRKLKTHSANLLPGRSHVFHLYPIIQTERSETVEILKMPVLHEPYFKKKTLEELLLFGSMPGVQNEKPKTAQKTLEGYAQLYLEEEIRREGVVRDIGPFARFLEFAALESGKIVNLTKLSNETGVPVATLRTYYQVLEDTFVGYFLSAFSGSSRKRVLNTPKFLFFDNGVRNATAKLSFSNDLIKTQGGFMFESWVGQELIHRCRYLGPAYQVYFWRTVEGVEVDYVIKTPKEIIPVEVKWTDKPIDQHAKNIEKLIRETPQAKRGFVVCRVKEVRQISENVKAIPWNWM